MIGYRPWPFMKYSWQYFTPALCIVSTGNVGLPALLLCPCCSSCDWRMTHTCVLRVAPVSARWTPLPALMHYTDTQHCSLSCWLVYCITKAFLTIFYSLTSQLTPCLLKDWLNWDLKESHIPISLSLFSSSLVSTSVFQFTFIFSLVRYAPLKFNNTYQYPWWGYAIGWFLTLSSTLMVPLWMLYAVCVTPGTLKQVRPHSSSVRIGLKMYAWQWQRCKSHSEWLSVSYLEQGNRVKEYK